MKKKEDDLWQRALAVIPGGVNSPVRAFRAVGGEPCFIASASGSRLRTTDGREMIDYVCSWGPLILGHAPPVVLIAIEEALRKGTSYGMPTPGEVKLAELVVDAFPSIEKVRLTSSGTEAAMSAIRLARAFTGRDTILKFSGCYHGHSDGLLVKAGSGAMTLSLPDSAGVPRSLVRETISLPYNDLDAFESLMKEMGDKIACVIVEPIAGNMGVIPPVDGFLNGLRELTRTHGALLVFDEVITGFRVAYGGAQELSGIEPDLTVLGKILGGGLPIGAFGGKRKIMEQLAPAGPVYQAGTLSGNPLAVAAGVATLTLLSNRQIYPRLEKKAAMLADGLKEACRTADIPCFLSRVGSMFTLFFCKGPVRNREEADRADRRIFSRFFHGMLERGVFFPPSQFEAAFISTTHSARDIDQTISAARTALTEAKTH